MTVPKILEIQDSGFEQLSCTTLVKGRAYGLHSSRTIDVRGDRCTVMDVRSGGTDDLEEI